MKSVIWKYVLPTELDITLEMPEGRPEILDVQMQGGKAVLWASVDPTQRKVPHHFRVVPTGQEFDCTGLTYIGTFQAQLGLVFHLFSVHG